MQIYSLFSENFKVLIFAQNTGFLFTNIKTNFC